MSKINEHQYFIEYFEFLHLKNMGVGKKRCKAYIYCGFLHCLSSKMILFVFNIDKKYLYVIMYINNIKELIAIKDVILFKIVLSCIILNNNCEERKQEHFEELVKNLELYNYQKEYIKILLEEERKRKYKCLS